jgi:hypothetical protein
MTLLVLEKEFPRIHDRPEQVDDARIPILGASKVSLSGPHFLLQWVATERGKIDFLDDLPIAQTYIPAGA